MFSIGLGKIRKALRVLDIKFLRLRVSKCPLHGPSVFVRLNDSMLGVRCMICGAAPIATAMAKVLTNYKPGFKNKRIYELSARGAFCEFLNRNVEDVVFSEYMENVQPGDSLNGVLCQDVQRLTFNDGEFDICTSTEVFEHVPDDVKGFSEIYRVLKEDGVFIFTVPRYEKAKTVSRAVMEDGEVRHLLDPEYHDDSIRGAGKVLVFRDYGLDIVNKLLNIEYIMSIML